jgi:hypothetical protein
VFVPSGLEDGHGREIKLKYGQPGDRLWVRERFAVMDRRGFQDHRRDSIKYDVNPESIIVQRPSIHMPRWASRITLEITGVRVERLQAGSTVSFYREGVSVADPNAFFARLWDSINGPGAWDKNPWVWVVEFKKI